MDTLTDHVRWLHSAADDVHFIAYGLQGEQPLTRRQALHLGHEVHAQRVEAMRHVIEQLIERVDAPAPEANSSSSRPLSSWVGNRSPAWHAVFAMNSVPQVPIWFIELDEEAQRICMALAAHYLADAIEDRWRLPKKI